jgi:DNA-binding response OmpR family regulator/Tfp pilus assembly protein PilF
MAKAPEINFSALSVLVIDDHPGMRSSLRMTLSNFGVTKTDMSQGAFDAVHRIKQRPYDIIVCDYNLGEGRNGQQLLEELRLGKLISPATVFLMVTAERSYEKVISAAELAPDDYLVKPFTAEALQQRLGQILKKKAAFAPVYRAIEEQRPGRAIEACARICQSNPAYTVDAWRMKAELLLSTGQAAEARDIYQQIIGLRAVPWARLGLAKSYFLQDDLAMARTLAEELVEAAPDFMSAQDFLARVQEMNNDSIAAMGTLARAAERSPNVIARQRNLGEVAYARGEFGVAERAYGNIVARGAYSILRDPEDHGRLARTQIEQGKLADAAGTLKELRQRYPNDPAAAFAANVVESLKETRAGNHDAARHLLDAAMKVHREHNLAPSENLSLDLAQACLNNGQEEEGKRLLQDLVNNNHENQRLLAKTRQVFAAAGIAEEGEKMINDGVAQAVALNNAAVGQARKGELVEAASMLKEAAERLPNNVQILLNAAHAQLTLIAQEGWTETRANIADGFIARARQRDPEHPKLIKVLALQRALAKKNGVNP